MATMLTFWTPTGKHYAIFENYTEAYQTRDAMARLKCIRGKANDYLGSVIERVTWTGESAITCGTTRSTNGG